MSLTASQHESRLSFLSEWQGEEGEGRLSFDLVQSVDRDAAPKLLLHLSEVSSVRGLEEGILVPHESLGGEIQQLLSLIGPTTLNKGGEGGNDWGTKKCTVLKTKGVLAEYG